MTAETKKTEWTNEDKAWAIGGGVTVAVGLGYWWWKNKKDKETQALTDAATGDTTYIDQQEILAIGTGSNSGSSTNSGTDTVATTPASTTRGADPVRWSVGMVMMANSKAGTKAYEAKKMANGQYNSDGTLVKTFGMGTEIGKIIQVIARTDGTFRYVLENDGTFTNDYYWIADYRVITPTNGAKSVSTTKAPATATGLNTTLILKKGTKGLEVRELQKRLGVAIDGDFGINTLTALQKQKGVSQITLASFGTTSGSVLNFNLMLKKGSKGLEVKELQKRLGFTGFNVDGDFGVKTESALFAMKSVKQTTLNQFSYA